MVRRRGHAEASCPIARALDAIGDWWSLLIVRDAFDGLRRFSEFQKNIGLAKNILSARLRNLVNDGILTTAPASDGSAYAEYVLTAKGSALFPVVVALRQWAADYCFRPGETHVELVDVRNEQPVRKLEIRSRDGRLLKPEDTVVKAPANSQPPTRKPQAARKPRASRARRGGVESPRGS